MTVIQCPPTIRLPTNQFNLIFSCTVIIFPFVWKNVCVTESVKIFVPVHTIHMESYGCTIGNIQTFVVAASQQISLVSFRELWVKWTTWQSLRRMPLYVEHMFFLWGKMRSKKAANRKTSTLSSSTSKHKDGDNMDVLLNVEESSPGTSSDPLKGKAIYTSKARKAVGPRYFILSMV